MKIRYVAGNLLSANTPIVHAVCSELTMKVGTSKLIADTHPKIKSRINQDANDYVKVGECYETIFGPENTVYTLIDKATVRDIPTLDDITRCFVRLRARLLEDEDIGISDISMPRIGCGRDKLDWEDVRDLLINVFGDLDMTIYVYQYVDEEDDVRNNNYQEAIREHAIILSSYDDVLINPDGTLEISKELFSYGSVGDEVSIYCEEDGNFSEYRITCEKLYTYTFEITNIVPQEFCDD